MSDTKGHWEARHISGKGMIQAFDFRVGACPVFNKDSHAIDGAAVYCSPEDALRIVACVNAFEGIPTAQVECLVKGLLEQNKEHARFVLVDHAKVCGQLTAHQSALNVATDALNSIMFSSASQHWKATQTAREALDKIKEIVK